MFSLGRKINLLLISPPLFVAAAIIILNTYFYPEDMRNQLLNAQLPLMSDGILSKIDKTIMEPARGLALAATTIGKRGATLSRASLIFPVYRRR